MFLIGIFCGVLLGAGTVFGSEMLAEHHLRRWRRGLARMAPLCQGEPIPYANIEKTALNQGLVAPQGQPEV